VLAALVMYVLAPDPVAGQVAFGLILPVQMYGLVLPLVALGVAVALLDTGALIASLIVFALVLGAALANADRFLFSYLDVLALVVRYPVCAATMCAAGGLALVLPGWLRRWCVPFMAAVMGAGLGISIVLSGPGDEATDWFETAAGLTGLVIVSASGALGAALQGPGLTVASRILGSWLIAAAIMLGGLALAPKPVHEPAPGAVLTFPEVDLSHQP
jgi:hypothetical protein